MREGLRSGKLRAGPEDDEGVAGGVIVEVVGKRTRSSSAKMHVLEPASVGIGDRRSVLFEGGDKCILRVETDALGSECCESESRGDHVSKATLGDSRKRCLDNCSAEINNNEPAEKKVKEESLGDRIHNVGRILRSRTIVNCGGRNESAIQENKATKIEEKRSSPGFEIKEEKRSRTIVNCGGRNESAIQENEATKIEEKRSSPGFEIKEEKIYELVEQSPKEFKRKRGRPPKLHGKIGILEKKLQKKELVEQSPKREFKRKRGRPPKVHGKNGILEKKLKKKEKRHSLRKSEGILKSKESLKETFPLRGSSMVRRSHRNNYAVKRLSPAKKGKHVNMEVGEDVVGPSSKLGICSDKQSETKGWNTEDCEGDAGIGRRLEKKLVRDKVVDLLMNAGWKIDYRPRLGRDYTDAVYVSPDGKTHWSVTLAYRVLKERYEAGNAESKAYKTGFVFTPIPDDELQMLTRVVVKKRKGKKKNKEDKGMKDRNETNKAIKKKKHKGKHTSHAASKYPSRVKTKGNSSAFEMDNAGSTTQHGSLASYGKRKRRETENKNRCGLLVRRSEGTESDTENYILYSGKRTVLAWMIDLGTVLDKGKVQYRHPNDEKAKLEGRITRDGIHCNCCGEVIRVVEFEGHAGSKLCHPLENIYLENATSMLQCQLDSWRKKEESYQKWFHFIDVEGDDPNDDTCGICGDGGDLVCCDGCPATFHQNCLDIQKFPSGDWHCFHCSCKFCGTIADIALERDSNGDNTLSVLSRCRLCEKKYHGSCVHVVDEVKEVQDLSSFCGRTCQNIYEEVRMLLGVKHELEEGYYWTIVQRFEIGIDNSPADLARKVECNSKVAVAYSVMEECFLPAIDHRSGIDLIHNILYNCGSNFIRLDFSSFYTVILEKGDEIISAASIRIHGNQLAEMPFIGTRYMYRRQGMCRRLLIGIESVLRSLKVQKLVIPAISELKETWTSVFGFEPVENSLRERMRKMNILVFPGVDMLQKSLLTFQQTEENSLQTEDLNVAYECTVPNMNVTEDAPKRNPDEYDIEGMPIFSKSTPHLGGSLNDASDITSDTVDSDYLAERKDPSELDKPCGAEARIEVRHSMSDSYTRVSEIALHDNAKHGSFAPISNAVTFKVDGDQHSDFKQHVERLPCAESCSVSDRGDSQEHRVCGLQMVVSDVEAESNTVNIKPHNDDSRESYGDGKHALAPISRSMCPESTGEMFHDAKDETLSTAECVSYSDDKMPPDSGVHQECSVPTDGCTTSTESCNQLLPVAHSSSSNEEVCPSADEELHVVTNRAVQALDCNLNPRQANGAVTSQEIVGCDCIDSNNQQFCDASGHGSVKPQVPSSATNGNILSSKVISELKEQSVNCVHALNK